LQHLCHDAAVARICQRQLILVNIAKFVVIFGSFVDLLWFHAPIKVVITNDLSLDRHVSRICAGCYYQRLFNISMVYISMATTDFVNCLRRIRRSLATLVYKRRCEFTDQLLQHCSCWCTKDSHGQVTAYVEDGLRFVTGTRKFDRGLGKIQ